MRAFLLVLSGVLIVFPTALADEANLSGGALITHFVPEIVYSTTPPPCGDWCCAYEGHEITDPAQEIVRIDEGTTAVWYVLAAWAEDKEWCAVEFGFDTYDADILHFYESGPCFPVEGLEISTAGWPGPNQGTAIVVVGDDDWTGNWVPVYFFASYAYAGVGVIQLGPDPGSVNTFIGFSNCETLPMDFRIPENIPGRIRRGGMGINTEGVRAAPSTEPLAVCCVEVWCFILPELECADIGGEWHPELGESCEGNPCDPEAVCCWGTWPRQCSIMTQSVCKARPTGVWHPELTSCDPDPCKYAVCCVDVVCYILTELECVLIGGDVWLEMLESCEPNPCPANACCIPGQPCENLPELDCLAIEGATWHEGFRCDEADCDNLAACCVNAVCFLMWEEECTQTGGTFYPNYTSCDPDPCPFTPEQSTSWGKIKALYR